MKTLAVMTVIAAAFAVAQNQTVQQDGQFWVRSGRTDPKQLSDRVQRLEIFTRANVIVRGSTDSTIQVKMRQRVRASSADEANRLWGPGTQIGPFVAAGNLMRIDLSLPGSSRVITELEISVPKQLPFVMVNNRSGSIEVYDLDGNVQIDTVGGPLTADRIRGDVRGHTGFGQIRLGTIGGSAQCSSGGGSITLESALGGLNCVTAGGDIDVKSAAGQIAVSTEGGNVHIEKAGANVRARSVAGLIEVVQAKGAVFADTGGGSIQVGAANGVRAESAAGTIRVKGGSGPLTVSTMLGNILAEMMPGGRFADSSLFAGSGDITVLIPSGMGMAIRARNDSDFSPRIISDFPELEVKSIGFRSPQGQGAINGGGPVLDLNTSGGAIYLRRVK
ncbi:MAG: hypothetical protein ABIR70_10895 [Bryobacteraceae bacterium]